MEPPAGGGTQLRPFLAPPAPDGLAPGPEPTFSIVIAAYESAGTIGDAVESVLGQTRPPLEVIVCDDGSTDDLAGALRPFGERVTLIRQENAGEGAAKDRASRAAAGEFVVVLDADDRFLPERLEALAELVVARPDLDVLTTDALVEVDGTVEGRYYTPSNRFVVDDQPRGILEANFLFGLAALRRERLLAVGGFDSARRTLADWDCWIRLIVGGARAGLVDEPLAVYRLQPASVTASRLSLLRGRVAVLEQARSLELSAGERRTASTSLAAARRTLELEEAREALLERQAGARRRALKIALGVRPYSLPTRAKALVAAAAPGVARGRLAEQDRQARSSAAGLRQLRE